MSGPLTLWLAADARPAFNALQLNADALEALAHERLARLLRSAARTEFYRARLDAAGIDLADPTIERDPVAALTALPPVAKRELREAGPRALAGGRVGLGWRSSLSSGSTGEPFRVYYGSRAWAMLKYLVKLRARFECGVRPTDRIAALEAALPPGSPQMGPSSLPFYQRLARLNVLTPVDELADLLARFAPDVLTGLPSALLETGRAFYAKDRRLPLRAIFTGGELLQRTTRDALEQMYGTRVFDVYGTSETKEIAWECRLGGMHVNADVVHVEVLDESGNRLPPGCEGEIVATVLVNHAMPLLRYRTGDCGSLLHGRCLCGRATPLLGVVTGRETEMLVFAGGRRVSPYALTCTLEQVAGLTQYQVLQVGPARVTVRAIVSSDADRDAIAGQVRATLRAEVAPFLEVQVEFVERLPTGPRAKFRVVQRIESS